MIILTTQSLNYLLQRTSTAYQGRKMQITSKVEDKGIYPNSHVNWYERKDMEIYLHGIEN